MFNPKFTYTNKLVNNIGLIRELIGALNTKRFPNTVLVQFEKDARALSSFSSTSIEGNRLPLTDVKKILKSKPDNIHESEREVLNYNNALIYLNEIIKTDLKFRLSDALICRIQKLVIEKLAPKSQTGKYRQQPVFVNVPIKRQTVYWAPDHADVPKLILELLEYIKTNESEIDFIVLAGIFHQQFVIIHPFIDGNGRTTRLLTKALLAKLGLDTFQLFSFENYYNANVSRYFQKVGMKGNYYDKYKNWDFTEWLEYFTDGIIDELNRVQKLLPRPTSLNDRIEVHHQSILDLLNERAVIQSSDYAKVTDRSRTSRVQDFQRLIDLGLIERRGMGRNAYYILKD